MKMKLAHRLVVLMALMAALVVMAGSQGSDAVEVAKNARPKKASVLQAGSGGSHKKAAKDSFKSTHKFKLPKGDIDAAIAKLKDAKTADADKGPSSSELKSMQTAYAKRVASLKKAGKLKLKSSSKKKKKKKTTTKKGGKKGSSFLQLHAALEASRTDNIPQTILQLWLESREYIEGEGLDPNNQYAIVGYYSEDGFERVSAPVGYNAATNSHSEQRLNDAGWLTLEADGGKIPDGVTDVVMYTTFSPCHNRQDGHEGCFPSVIVPAAERLAAAGIHLTVIFNSRYAASGNYDWADDVWPTMIAHDEVVDAAEGGFFEMWQVNKATTKTKTKKHGFQYFGQDGAGGPNPAKTML